MSQKEKFISQNAASSALGGITLSGLLHTSRGIPRTSMRVLGSYALVYVFDGDGHYLDANKIKRRISPGDLIIVFPEIAHAYGPESGKTWSEFHLVFNGPVFDLWRQTGLLNPAEPVHHLEPVDHWLRRFESVLGGPKANSWAPALHEVCRLQQVLAEAVLGGPKGHIRQDDLRWASHACALIEADLAQNTDLARTADKLGTSYESFRKRFTRIVGIPPARYRSTRIIDRACEFMQKGDMSDKQIALELGFYDEFHFSRRFKQVIGISPRQFRNSLPLTN